MNQKTKIPSVLKLNLNTDLKSNPKKLTLYGNPQRKSSTKKNYNIQLPGICQRFVLQLIENQQTVKETQVQVTEISSIQFTPQKVRRFHSVNSKTFLKSKKNLFNVEVTQHKTIQLKNQEERQILLRNKNLSISKRFCSDDKNQYNSKNSKKENKVVSKRTISCIPSQEKLSKNFVSIGVQKNDQTTNRESYNEFLKFNITKREKFQKFQNLMSYIQTLTGLEQQNFKNNTQELSSILKNNANDQRQTRVQELMNDLEISMRDFNLLFKQNFIKERVILRDLLTNQNHFQTKTQKLFKQAENKILQLMLEKQIFNLSISPKDIQQILINVSKTQDSIFEQKNHILKQFYTYFYTNYKSLEGKYATWYQNASEQSTLIKNCVIKIMELPELSINFFGSDMENDHDQTNNEIKNYCMNKKKIPHISDFFVKRGNPRENQIDQIFSKCCEIKCMNCIYIRSKMRFIYEKNKQLKPVIKALMSLVQSESREQNIQKRWSKFH